MKKISNSKLGSFALLVALSFLLLPSIGCEENHSNRITDLFIMLDVIDSPVNNYSILESDYLVEINFARPESSTGFISFRDGMKTYGDTVGIESNLDGIKGFNITAEVHANKYFYAGEETGSVEALTADLECDNCNWVLPVDIISGLKINAFECRFNPNEPYSCSIIIIASDDEFTILLQGVLVEGTGDIDSFKGSVNRFIESLNIDFDTWRENYL
jgi:hypothetical protein